MARLIRLLTVSVATMAALTVSANTATTVERPGHYRPDTVLDTTQVERGAPLPDCPGDGVAAATACQWVDNDLTVLAEPLPDGATLNTYPDGTTFTNPGSEG